MKPPLIRTNGNHSLTKHFALPMSGPVLCSKLPERNARDQLWATTGPGMTEIQASDSLFIDIGPAAYLSIPSSPLLHKENTLLFPLNESQPEHDDTLAHTFTNK